MGGYPKDFFDDCKKSSMWCQSEFYPHKATCTFTLGSEYGYILDYIDIEGARYSFEVSHIRNGVTA